MCVVHRKHNLFIYYIFIRNKKVIYSLSWSKSDMASAASCEVPMTKEVVNSLTNLGKIILLFWCVKPLLELMHLPDAILYFDDNVDLQTRHKSFYLVSFLIIFSFILLYLGSTTTKGHRVGEVAHDYVPALKQWLNGKGINNSYDTWHGMVIILKSCCREGLHSMKGSWTSTNHCIYC